MGGLGFGLNPRFDLRLGGGNRRQTLLAAAEFFGQVHTVRQVLGVSRFRPLDQFRHFGLELGLQLLGVAVTHRTVARGVGMHLGPVQAHRAQLQHPHLPGVAQHLHEDCLDLPQEPLAETVDRVVIRMGVRRDVAKGDRVIARPFQGPAGERASGIAIEQQRHQHPRVMRLTAATGIALLKARQIELLDHVDHEPRQMIFRQPLLHTRWKQKLRIAINRNKARHGFTHGKTSMQFSVVKISRNESPTGS
jgi:hypothetical protein